MHQPGLLASPGFGALSRHSGPEHANGDRAPSGETERPKGNEFSTSTTFLTHPLSHQWSTRCFKEKGIPIPGLDLYILLYIWMSSSSFLPTKEDGSESSSQKRRLGCFSWRCPSPFSIHTRDESLCSNETNPLHSLALETLTTSSSTTRTRRTRLLRDPFVLNRAVPPEARPSRFGSGLPWCPPPPPVTSRRSPGEDECRALETGAFSTHG